MKSTILITFLFIYTISNSYGQEIPNFFGQPPLQYINSEHVEILVKTDSVTMKRLVPKPLVPDSSNTIKIYLVKHRYSKWVYNEVTVSILANFKGKTKDYAKILYLEDSAPMTAGREIWGFPKVDANINYIKNEDSINFTLTRQKETLLTLKAKLNLKDSSIHKIQEASGYVIKEIPSATGSTVPDVKKLNTYILRDLRLYDSQKVDVLELNINPSKINYMPDFGDYEILNVSVFSLDFLLDYGEELYDYLKKE